MLTLLKNNPKYWLNFGAVFLFVPTFAVTSVYHAVKSPDVILTRQNYEPWQKYDNKQHHFLSAIDHQNYVHPRPRF